MTNTTTTAQDPGAYQDGTVVHRSAGMDERFSTAERAAERVAQLRGLR